MKNVRKYKSLISCKSDERGMIVVEAVISFTAFIMVCLGIVFLINIFTLHNKVQFAINQAAHEIASYSYLADAFGGRALMMGLDSDFGEYADEVDDTANQVCDTINKMQDFGSQAQGIAGSFSNLSDLDINSVTDKMDQLKNSGGALIDSGKQSVADLKTLFSDPKGMLVGVLYIGVKCLEDSALRLVAEAAGGALTEKYMESGGLDVDAYLASFGIEGGYDGLDFSGSSIFCDDNMQMIDIVVEYDIDLSFITYVLPQTKFHVIQRASMAGWVGGDDQVVGVGKP